MYYEIGYFMKRVVFRRALWKDGEFGTALIIGLAAYGWFSCDPEAISRIRAHFTDLLSATSIIFGFVLAALLFYIQAASAWAKDPKVGSVANRIVDWHVWTISCMLSLIAYLLALWSFGPYLSGVGVLVKCLYSFLTFLLAYCGLQILNHTMTVWWSFRVRDTLSSTMMPDDQSR